jgi:serine/threonine protein kinase
MSEKKYQRFGKYLILDHLVDGGMAKICRARYLGEQANKIVAVKMVQPQFSSDEAFVRMFQDELNITFGMLHPNIMQVYDYGKTNGQLYTAMEYIHGANLKQYLDRLKEKKVVFPVEISCYIVSQVCLGLHYAHTFTDKLTGKPFNVVHRDISPHNIMLTYDGAVKVIDFGIAKANTNSEATQAGTIKGKLSYLAPEYLDGLELDARYDEFAVGITLWEMLCSRKLFQANNDLAVLKQIQACKIIPPSEINPLVPKELDTIVMKALSKDRAQRYENLDQMNRALVRFLYSTYPEFNATDLKSFAYDLFQSEIAKDQNSFVEYGKIDIQPYIEDMKQEESRTGKIAKKDIGMSGRPTGPGKKEEPVHEKIRELEMKIESVEGLELGLEKSTSSGPTRENTATKKLTKQSLQSAKSVSKNNKLNSSISYSRSQHKDKTSSKLMNKKDISEESTKSSIPAPITIIILVASVAAIAYINSDLVYEFTGIDIAGNNQNEASRSISSEPKLKKNRSTQTIPPSEKGEIILGGTDISMEIYLNGTKIEYVGTPIKVDLDQEVTISVKKTGHIPFVSKVTLSKSETSRVISVPPMDKSRMGLLSTSQNYTAGSKLVYEEDGVLVERPLPFKDQEIPEGTYQAKVVNPILGTEKRVEFSIEENKKHFLE